MNLVYKGFHEASSFFVNVDDVYISGDFNLEPTTIFKIISNYIGRYKYYLKSRDVKSDFNIKTKILNTKNSFISENKSKSIASCLDNVIHIKKIYGSETSKNYYEVEVEEELSQEDSKYVSDHIPLNVKSYNADNIENFTNESIKTAIVSM